MGSSPRHPERPSGAQPPVREHILPSPDGEGPCLPRKAEKREGPLQLSRAPLKTQGLGPGRGHTRAWCGEGCGGTQGLSRRARCSLLVRDQAALRLQGTKTVC